MYCPVQAAKPSVLLKLPFSVPLTGTVAEGITEIHFSYCLSALEEGGGEVGGKESGIAK